MFYELIAVIVAGFAGAGVVMLLNRIVGGRLPRWLMPAGAGAAMLGLAISNEYGWYPHTSGSLPETFAVVNTVEERAMWRPWTYAVPYVSRFLAVDTASLRTNDAVPGQRIYDLYAFGRWSAPARLGVVVDCTAGRRAELVEGVNFAEDGKIEGANWREVGKDDPILSATCGS